jgi:hypothetical protein
MLPFRHWIVNDSDQPEAVVCASASKSYIQQKVAAHGQQSDPRKKTAQAVNSTEIRNRCWTTRRQSIKTLNWPLLSDPVRTSNDVFNNHLQRRSPS